MSDSAPPRADPPRADDRTPSSTGSESRAEAASSWQRALMNALEWIKPHQFVRWLVAFVLVALGAVGGAFLIGAFSDTGDDTTSLEAADRTDQAPTSADEPVEQVDEGDEAPAQPEPPVEGEDEAPAQREPPVDEASQLIASAAGVYRLQEESMRIAIESGSSAVSFVSAEGAIVLGEDGTVSGDYQYVGTQTGFDTLYGVDLVSQITADFTMDPANPPQLVESDEGLTFDVSMIVSFYVEPTTRFEPYRTPGGNFEMSGLLAPELGLLELSTPGAEFSLDFLR